MVEIWNHRDDLGLMEQLGARVSAGYSEQRKLAADRGASCGDAVTTLSCTYDPLDVLWREELWDRHRPFDGTEEAVRFLLVAAQRGEELLHLG